MDFCEKTELQTARIVNKAT